MNMYYYYWPITFWYSALHYLLEQQARQLPPKPTLHRTAYRQPFRQVMRSVNRNH